MILMWAEGDSSPYVLSFQDLVEHWPKEWLDWSRKSQLGDATRIDNVYLVRINDQAAVHLQGLLQ